MTRMTVSQAYNTLWSTGIVFVILPHLNLGLLSDYKICGDSECESPMSRVVAIKDHHGKDCRFLSFRRGDTIFVYHKLTGKREDLWAGSIDKQFGYFPKDAVQEKDVHATVEKVVETQESDFFCMDELGYPIDSSHLDSDDDEKIQNQESETTQTTPYTDDTNVESPQTSEDISTESPVPAKETDPTSTAEDESKSTADASATAHEEEQEAPAALKEQGGSAPSAWFGSSVTGWLGLATVEEPGNLAEDERKEKQAEASFMSSVTEWLGLEGEEQPDDAKKSREEERESVDSFASTGTGWLGFGGEKRTDHSAEKDQDEEGENDEEQEPADKFRSRRMSLNLEGSQSHGEEKEEMGTLDWLGKGLSDQLGFSLTDQASGHEATTEREDKEVIQAEEEQPASSSWFDMGIRDILGFRKDNSEVDERTKSDFNESEKDEISEQTTGSESQSQAALTEEGKTEISNEPKVEETLKDQNQRPSEVETVPGSVDSNKSNTGIYIGMSDSSKDNVLPEDTASEDSRKDISTQNKLEEKSQAGLSSVLSSFFQKGSEIEEGHNVLDDNKKETNTPDGETSAEMEDKDQLPKSAENMGDDNNDTERGEDVKTTDEGFLTQYGINFAPDFSSVVLNSNSRPQSVGEEGRTEGGAEKMSEISTQIDKTEESTDMSAKIGTSSDGDEGKGSYAESGAFQREVSTTQTDDMAEQSQVGGGVEESRGENEVFLSSGTTVDRKEPASNEDDTAHSEETSVHPLDPLVMIDNNTEAETHQGDLGQEGEGHPVEGSSPEFGSSRSTNRNTDIIAEDASEDARRTFYTSESSTLSADDVNQDSAHTQQTDTDSQNKLQPVQTETIGFEKYILNESGTDIGSETETEEVEESKKEEKQVEREELKEEEEVEALGKQQEADEEKQGEAGELKEEEKQQVVKESEEDGKQEEIEEVKQERKQEVVEVIKEKTQEEVEKITEEEMQREEEEFEDEVEGIKGKNNQEELEKEGENQAAKELKEYKERVEEEELKEDEKQQQVEEIEEEKQKRVEEERAEEFKEVEEIKVEEKKVGEDKLVQSSHFKVEMENLLHSSLDHQKDINRPESECNEGETEGENSFKSETFTQNKKQEEETKKIKEEGTRENVEGERRDKEEEEERNLTCSNEPFLKACEDRFLMERDGDDSANRVSSKDEAEQETGKRTAVSQTVPSEGMERDEDREQEEEKRNDADADEGKEELTEKNSELNTAGNDDIKTNNDSISDLNVLGVKHIRKHSSADSDLLSSGESSSNHILPGQRAENKEEELYSKEAKKNTNLSDDKLLHQGDKTKPGGTETSSSGISDTDEDTNQEEMEINMKHDDVNEEADTQMTKSKAVISEQPNPHVSQHPTGSSLLSDGHTNSIAETGGGGAFGLFQNAFSFFKQTPTTESTESTPSLDANEGEASTVHSSLTPEQELDPATDSAQVYSHDPPITLSQQHLSHPSSVSPNAGSPLLSKHYKSLLAYMSVDERNILMELFGRHKLQFLDYMLGSSETMTDATDNDESILSDIERLLRYHRETLEGHGMRLVDAHEDKDKSRTLITLQKLEQLLARVRETFNTGKSLISNTNHQAAAGCFSESCSAHSKTKEMAAEEESSKMGESSDPLDTNTPTDDWTRMDEEKGGHLNGGRGKEMVTEDGKGVERDKRSEEKRVSTESRPHVQPLEGVMEQIVDLVHQIAEDSTTHVHAVKELLIWFIIQVVSTLPDDIKPGPDLYGVPWEPVIFSSLVGLMTMLLFTCRCYNSVKSRMYRSKEQWMAEQVAQLLDEKCKVLETLSKCQQEYDDLENSLRDSGVLARTQKTEHLEGKVTQLGHANRELERDLEQLKDQLDQQREHRREQGRRIATLEENMKTYEEEIKDLQSQDEQAQTTLKVYNMNSDRLQRNLETAGEENTLLQESNAQLRQQVEGWAERVSELEAEMSRCEVSHSVMLQDVANKDERIMSLTDRLLRMKAWDSDVEREEGQEGGEKENGSGDKVDTQSHLQKVQKLIYAAKLNADLKSVDEDKDRAFAKLNDEVKAKEDLLVSIMELENEKLSLQSDTEHFSDQVQRLQQKLNIMTEMYQENELKLHRLLTVEEKERLQKEEKLNKADKNIAMAIEELNNYRQRAVEMEEELEKTKQSYQTQISAHENKAHNNWLAARAADRDLSDIRRENGLLRQKLTDTQFKLDALDKDPYALDSLARPLPFRAERSPYGHSPLGRPTSENRAFLSPPTLMDGPPTRLSPRVPRGPVEPPGGQGDMERIGGPHSDSGSNSPSWERDRRGPPPGPPGPLVPPGYMFPEPVGPMYKRLPLPPGPLGYLPPPGVLPLAPLHPRNFPPGPPHPADMTDGSYRENSLGPGEQQHREPSPGDRRTPPEADPRMGGPPPPGPPMGPMDGPFPRRAPYRPPPPDFYPPRGPGGPPMMPMWALPPPGVMFPPRFPPGGPPLPHPHYAPPMRPPLHDGPPPPSFGPHPPQQSLPSAPHRQSPDEHIPSPEDAI